jgi:hypothetical protein
MAVWCAAQFIITPSAPRTAPLGGFITLHQQSNVVQRPA